MFAMKPAGALLNILLALLVIGQGFLFSAGERWQEDEPKVEILSPGGGTALQGVVAITGTTDMAGFRSAEISFAYQSDQTRTWFIIQQMTRPVKEGSLASWDTTTITDGDYRLRLQVILEGGEVQEFVVGGLRVRNYTRIETSTPEAGSRLETPTLTASPLPDFQVTPRSPTPAPTNPAELSAVDLQKSVLGGAVGVLAALALGALYIGGRRVFRR